MPRSPESVSVAMPNVNDSNDNNNNNNVDSAVENEFGYIDFGRRRLPTEQPDHEQRIGRHRRVSMLMSPNNHVLGIHVNPWKSSKKIANPVENENEKWEAAALSHDFNRISGPEGSLGMHGSNGSAAVPPHTSLATEQPFLTRWRLWMTPDLITYQICFWTSFVLLGVASVLERFTLNLMPFGQLPDEAMKNSSGALYAFHVVERVSARLMMLVIAYFFVSMCRVFNNTMCEYVSSSSMFRSWLSFDDWAHASYRGHRRLGLYLFILTVVVHVGGAFLPLLDGLEFSLTDEALFPFVIPRVRKFPFGFFKGKWSMRVDDLYQGVVGLLLALLLQPFTILWYRYRTKQYNLTVCLHITGAILVVWLIYRVPEHVRTFAFMTAPIAMWMVDRYLHGYVYRRHELRTTVQMRVLNTQYFLLSWTPPEQLCQPHEIGDVYYLQMNQRRWDLAHAFTHFHYSMTVNASLNPDRAAKGSLPSQPSVSFTGGKLTLLNQHELANLRTQLGTNDEKSEAPMIDEANTRRRGLQVAIMRVFPGPTFTGALRHWLRTSGEARKSDFLTVCGPYRRVYRKLMATPQPSSYVLVATGSGVSYILDYLYWVRRSPETRFSHPVHITYSTHSPKLLQMVADVILKHVYVLNISATLHLTSFDMEDSRASAELEHGDEHGMVTSAVSIGRFDLNKVLKTASQDSRVFFCGAKCVYDDVKNQCRRFGLKFYSEVPYV